MSHTIYKVDVSIDVEQGGSFFVAKCHAEAWEAEAGDDYYTAAQRRGVSEKRFNIEPQHSYDRERAISYALTELAAKISGGR